MGNCLLSSNTRRKLKYVNPVQPVPIVPIEDNTKKGNMRRQIHEEEKRVYNRLTDEERAVVRQIKREEKERLIQAYNLERLRETLNTDMETFLLNNILFSVQFFENFERDRSSFTSLRLREQSRMNAEGPGGGLSSSKHKKRASLPDTMQEIVGRWVRLDPPILNSPMFPAKATKTTKSKSNVSLSQLSERLTCKELLAPLRIMVVHEDVRITEREDENLYRAIIPETIPKLAGFVRLRCIGNWPEERSDEIYESNLRTREMMMEIKSSEEGEYTHSSVYNGSEKVRENDSEYSYSCKKLYDKTLKDKGDLVEDNSSDSNTSSDDEGLDSFNAALLPGEKSFAGTKKKTAVPSMSQRPPMKPPQDLITVNPLPLDPELHIEDFNPPRLTFSGRRDSGTVQSLPPWTSKSLANSLYSASNSNKNKNTDAPQASSTTKESDNWKLGKTANFGNINSTSFNSPKPSLCTENSDSDYGYATIPTSYSPHSAPKRHGGIPHQCLTKVRYRHIEGEDEEFDMEGEELARRMEEQGGDTGQLFVTKTFLNPSHFLTAFGEEVWWRDCGYSSTRSNRCKSNSESQTASESQNANPSPRRRVSSKSSLDSGNIHEEDDDSLQACLGIPASVPVIAKEASWLSQRDRHGMRFPVEIIPSITIPWPREETVLWLHRKRNAVVIDERTKEKRPAWPGRLVQEAIRTACHAIVPPNLHHKNAEMLKMHQKQEQVQIPDLGWKLCFCEAERVIEEGLTHTQTRCLLFIMLLRRCYLQWEKFGLSQNFVRNTFYWQCERGYLNWPEEEMGYNVRSVLAEIYKGLKRRKLPDYFIRKRNVAEEEVSVALPKAQKVLHSMEEALSIHVARAISGLQFSDSRVPILDFKYLIQILTDEHIWMTLNPGLFGLPTTNDEEVEEEEDNVVQIEDPQPNDIPQKEEHEATEPKILTAMKNSKFLSSTITSKELDKGNAISENVAEFLRIGKKYKLNKGKLMQGQDPNKVEENTEDENTTKSKSIKVKIVKGTGTLNAKKHQQRPELNDAFSRLKKANKDREWNAQYRKHLADQKKKDKEKDESEADDMFAKAEQYKPAEVSSNQAKRQLLLSLFANHFEQLGRRCGRDWGALRVADSYLRHAENLAKLLREHEGVAVEDDDDDEENMGEAKSILDRLRREFEHLTNLRARKTDRFRKNLDDGCNTITLRSPNSSNAVKLKNEQREKTSEKMDLKSTEFLRERDKQGQQHRDSSFEDEHL